MSKRRFWHQGLKFQCHQCGNCCTFPGGFVYGSEKEFRKIAKHLDLPLEEFLEQYTESVDGYVSLKSPDNGPCILYDNGCSVYPARPSQCRTFPFWSDILKSPDRWDEQAETCRGIDKGKFWSKKEIKTQLDANTKIPMKTEPSP